MSAERLIERQRKSLAGNGLLRLGISTYRDRWGEPEEVTYDVVETADGATEVRLRVE